MFWSKKQEVAMLPSNINEACGVLEKIVHEEAKKLKIDLTQLDPNMDLFGPRKNKIYTQFIKARQFRLEDTKNMIMTSIKWRLEVKPYHVTVEEVLPIIKRGYCFIHEKDNNSNPIVWCAVQHHVDYSDKSEVYKKFVLFLMEEGIRHVNKILDTMSEPLPDLRATLVFDLKGFSTANMDFPLVKYLAENLQAHYPEVLAHTYMVEAPWMFSTCWAMIKGWLDPVVESKIMFVNRERLFAIIPPEKVPVCHGGKSEVKKTWLGEV